MDGEGGYLWRWLKGHLRVVSLFAVAGLAALAAVAVATVPDGSGVIHSCYQTVGGPGGAPAAGPNWRVIDPAAGQSCDPAGEAALNFSQQGAAGPPGATGPAGAPGPAGADGGSTPPDDCPAVVGHVTLSGQPNLSFDACRVLRVRIGGRGFASGESSGSTEYEITRLSDADSPKLLKAAVQGTLFKTATIEIYKPATTTVDQTFKLSNAAISSFKAGLGQVQPTDILTLIAASKKGS